MVVKKRTIKTQDIFIYFYIAAILGWILETVFAIMLENPEKRGFLYGPLCPIYGFGAIMLVLVNSALNRKNIKKMYIKFAVFAITFTILEYLSSVILEALFGMRWWDYTGLFLNFQGRIALGYSIAFGLIGIIFIKLILKPIKRLCEKLRKTLTPKGVNILVTMITMIFVIDIVLSCIRYAN